MVDLSIFSNSGNLLFFLICFVLLVIVSAIVFYIVKQIIKLCRNFFAKKDLKQIGSGEDLKVVVKELEESRKEREKVMGNMGTAGPKLQYNDHKDQKSKTETQEQKQSKWDEKEKNDIAGGLNKLKETDKDGNPSKLSGMPSLKDKSDEDASGPGSKIKIPIAKKFGGGNQSKGKETQEQKQSKWDEKEKKDIAGGLDKFKKEYRKEELSRFGMPKRESEANGDQSGPGAKIKILTAKKFGVDERPSVNKGSIENGPMQHDNGPYKGKEGLIASLKNNSSNAAAKDASIFAGKEEISRSDLRQKLRGSNVYQAERGAGLNLSPVERAKLEKQVFSQTLGRNISKTDLKLSLKKLNRKMLGAKDSAEHAKLRKEIKFFKKIGGIKS